MKNGKKYVRQTVQSIEIRWKAHLRSKMCRYLRYAIDKHGSENFKIEEIASGFDRESLDQMEQQLIASFETLSPKGYNLRTGGHSNSRLSEETRKKFSEVRMGKPRIGRAAKGAARYVKQPHQLRATCLNIETGIEFSYLNLSLCEFDGLCRQVINGCLSGSFYQHRGYRFKFASNDKYPDFKGKTSRIHINCLRTLDGRTLIGRDGDKIACSFTSIKDAVSAGYDGSHISRCLRNIPKNKTHKKIKWSLE